MKPSSLTNCLITNIFFTAGVLNLVSGDFIYSATLFSLACLTNKAPMLKPKPVPI